MQTSSQLFLSVIAFFWLINKGEMVRFFKRPGSILGALVGFKAIQTIYAFRHGELAIAEPEVHLLVLVVLLGLTPLALKGKKTALWLLAIYLFTQVGAIFFGVFIVPVDQFILKTISIVLGAYFVFGGVVLSKLAFRKTSN